jgi:hypothetical protein
MTSKPTGLQSQNRPTAIFQNLSDVIVCQWTLVGNPMNLAFDPELPAVQQRAGVPVGK